MFILLLLLLEYRKQSDSADLRSFACSKSESYCIISGLIIRRSKNITLYVETTKKNYTGDVHKNVTCEREFRENQCSESHTLLRVVY
jgi:hypothetical protein